MKPSLCAKRGAKPAAENFRLAPLLLAAALLQGCAAQTASTAAAQANATTPITTIKAVTIDGVPYPDATTGLTARQTKLDATVAQIAPENDPIKGRVRIVLPDRDRLRPLVAQIAAAATKRTVGGDALEFFDTEISQDVHEAANALVRSDAFQNATVVEQNDVLQPPDGDADFVVWFQVRSMLPNNAGAWVGGWLVRRRGNPATAGASLDPGTAAGAPREASFVKSVREAALRLGGRTVAGRSGADLPPANVGATAVSSTGSGIIINKTGDILTNAHVVNNCVAPKVVDERNARYGATVVAKDTTNDLALVKADHHWSETASFRDGSEIRPGDTVVATGYPLTGLVTSSMVVTTGSVSALTGPRDDSRLMQISAPVQPGNSGGPALDASGHVVGIVTSMLNSLPLMIATGGTTPQNVNFVTKSTIARNFLAAQNVDYAHAPSTRDLPSADVGAMARPFTVRIECGGP